jgi:hypothetical protein
VGACLCLHYLFVTFESGIVQFIYILKHLFPIETRIKNESKGEKPNTPYHPYGLRNLFKTINQ